MSMAALGNRASSIFWPPAASAMRNSAIGFPAAAGQLGSLPWTNVNIISVQFTEDVTVDAAQAVLLGSADLRLHPT